MRASYQPLQLVRFYHPPAAVAGTAATSTGNPAGTIATTASRSTAAITSSAAVIAITAISNGTAAAARLVCIGLPHERGAGAEASVRKLLHSPEKKPIFGVLSAFGLHDAGQPRPARGQG